MGRFCAAGSIARVATIGAMAAAVGAGMAGAGHAQRLSTAPAVKVNGGGWVPLHNMTVKIVNNSKKPLFAVLSTGATAPNSFWMQGDFQVPADQLATRTYANQKIYRVYVNPTGGIPVGGSVTLRLPLWSQIEEGRIGAPQGDAADQYINWWQGGRVSLSPSQAIVASHLAFDKAANKKSGFAGPVAESPVITCADCSDPPVVYQAEADFIENTPNQLTEYTFGGVDRSVVPYVVDDREVVYNISYVDSAYLPVAMEPWGNPLVGWVGTDQPVEMFQSTLSRFLRTPAYLGWPSFVNANDKAVPYKVPSAGFIFASESGASPSPILQTPGLAFEGMISNWKYCVAHTTNTGQVCSVIRELDTLYKANYAAYVAKWSTVWECPGEPRKLTSANGEIWYLSKVFGWVPFNETPAEGACKKPILNDIVDTPGYSIQEIIKIQAKYIWLQYTTDKDGVPIGAAFNPYVQLIHGDKQPNLFLNLPNAYSFSVDDGVGVMQQPGEGMVIAVGGAANLPNPHPFDRGGIVTVTLGFYGPGSPIQFTQYSACQNYGPDTQDLSYCPLMYPLKPGQGISVTSVRWDTLVTILDNQGRRYQFVIVKAPPFSSTDPNHPNRDMIACVPNDPNLSWCQGVQGYTIPANTGPMPHPLPLNYITAPPPLKP